MDSIPKSVFEQDPKRKHEGALVYLRCLLHNAVCLAISDAIALSIAILIAGWFRHRLFHGPFLSLWALYLIALWWFGSGLMRLLPSWGLGPVEELRRQTILMLAVHVTTSVALFLGHADMTHFVALWSGYLLSSILVPLTRTRVKRILIRLKLWGIPVVVYGAGKTGEMVLQLMRLEKGMGYIPAGALDDDPQKMDTTIEGVRIEGGTHLIKPRIPVAIVAMPNISRERMTELLDGPLSCYRKVMVIPELFDIPTLWVKPRDLHGMLGLEISSNLLNPLAQIAKRSIDIILIILSMPIWAPLCGCITLLIWMTERRLSPFFIQDRVGQKGRLIHAWKFRTMVPNAEQVLEKKLAENPDMQKEWETYYKLKKDPRITGIGKYLRRLSLDELPQCVNILRGDMSLVGPRPLPRYHHEELAHRVRELRERVRPGLTGLWQVSGRSDEGNVGMERWDSYYVRNWSPLLMQ